MENKRQSLADAIGRTPDMPEIANHIYSKEPDEKDIEWAKKKINKHTDVEALAEKEYPYTPGFHTTIADANRKGYIKGYTAALSKNEGWVSKYEVFETIDNYFKGSGVSGFVITLLKSKIADLPEAPKQ